VFVRQPRRGQRLVTRGRGHRCPRYTLVERPAAAAHARTVADGPSDRPSGRKAAKPASVRNDDLRWESVTYRLVISGGTDPHSRAERACMAQALRDEARASGWTADDVGDAIVALPNMHELLATPALWTLANLSRG
jgi:hypothetical protein